jgi:molybdopterin converting factor small subunit
MDVTIRCYGGVRTAVDARTIEVTLPEGATVATLFDRLRETRPGFDRLVRDGRAVVVMRGRRHLDRAAALADGDAVSLSTSPTRD